MPQKKLAKKVLPAIDDTRNDLLKAIRDGKFKQISFNMLCNSSCPLSRQASNCERSKKSSRKKSSAQRISTMSPRYWHDALPSNCPNPKIPKVMMTAKVGSNQTKRQLDHNRLSESKRYNLRTKQQTFNRNIIDQLNHHQTNTIPTNNVHR